ncbi:beta carbonic anhydrase 5 chloroplastic [Phtheirospermum japonicum]|uniref:Carbonic anhydrase n=1 Tax=Phtheirospermum japonicum TaxID=374723 RepID=A0A830BXK0_9LAMI|nr:beta carbonic anhydrase 5 chloroplastic [Phtheirospermum japonicum]
MESPAQETKDNKPKVEEVSDHFKELRHRFLGFKKDKYLSNLEHYQRLSEIQTPKFMVIACADSRVCPSTILGFQPGDAFVIRNVANLVPPHDNGPTETNAALEFAVNSLEVENLLVVGHSCCGGIKALMSLDDEVITSSFIRSWVFVGKPAKLKTKAAASNLDLDQQCRHCEKVCSLLFVLHNLIQIIIKLPLRFGLYTKRSNCLLKLQKHPFEAC